MKHYDPVRPLDQQLGALKITPKHKIKGEKPRLKKNRANLPNFSEPDKQSLRRSVKNAKVPEPTKRKWEKPHNNLLPPEARALQRTIVTSDLMKIDWRHPVGRAMFVHIVGWMLLGLVAAFLQGYGWQVAGLLGLCASLIMASLYRGLENLIHGASHFDIFRGSGKVLGMASSVLNDRVGNALMGFPVGQTVENFRQAHVVDHHGRFGSAADPCAGRMRAYPETQKNALPSVWSALRRVPIEVRAFYRGLANSRRTAIFAMFWHLAINVVSFSLLFGFGVALTSWAVVFVPTLFVVLPIVRCLAESGEHDYRPGSSALSVGERTFSHHGLFNRLIHLFGDQHHVEHHVAPAIPQYRLGHYRKRLIAAGVGRWLYRRTSVLGSVKPYQ